MRVSPRLAPRGTPKGGGQRRSPESPKIAVAVVRKRTYSCWCHMCLNVAAVSQSAPQAAHLTGRGGARSVRRTAPEVHGAGASPGRMAETAQLLPLISKHRAAGPPGAGRGSGCCTRRGAHHFHSLCAGTRLTNCVFRRRGRDEFRRRPGGIVIPPGRRTEIRQPGWAPFRRKATEQKSALPKQIQTNRLLEDTTQQSNCVRNKAHNDVCELKHCEDTQVHCV